MEEGQPTIASVAGGSLMRYRLLVALLLAAFILFISVESAGAGCWAVTSLDGVPD
jgi:hypothetical protein